jgi:hypothetical protein
MAAFNTAGVEVITGNRQGVRYKNALPQITRRYLSRRRRTHRLHVSYKGRSYRVSLADDIVLSTNLYMRGRAWREFDEILEVAAAAIDNGGADIRGDVMLCSADLSHHLAQL